MKEGDNARKAQSKTNFKKARAFKIPFEAKKVRCDDQKENSEAEKEKSYAEKA